MCAQVLVIAAIVGLLASPAAAEPKERNVKVGVALSQVVMNAADLEVQVFGVRGELSRALGPMQLVGSLSLGYGGTGTSVGLSARAAVAARRVIAGYDYAHGLLEVGLGRQWLRAPERVSRFDVFFGAIFEINDGDGPIMFIGAHFLVAREPRGAANAANAANAAATSGTARAGVALDTGLVTSYGVRW